MSKVIFLEMKFLCNDHKNEALLDIGVIGNRPSIYAPRIYRLNGT